MALHFPHEGVYARLGISKIHGIGVFAICDIRKGTPLFQSDQTGVHWFEKKEVDSLKLPPQIIKFYTDFSILKDGKYGCPLNFTSITIGWYMNEPQNGEQANVKVDENYDFFADRDIETGEELTVVYTTFSEPIERY
jgi:SET domain-containing protein